jgi:mono/diheme cytochrome c family protein
MSATRVALAARWASSLLTVWLLSVGCEPSVDRDPLSDLPAGDEQLQALCGRDRVDAVTTAFCRSEPPRIDGLSDVQRLLSLSPVATDGVPAAGFALTGHSSALFGRGVSALNPRAIFTGFPDERDDDNFVALAFARGEQVVELAAEPTSGDGAGRAAFYLLRYTQPCSGDDDGDGRDDCRLADRLTDRTESGWAGWSLYDDGDLKNTVFDCLHCHQPDGPGTPRIFRQQELQNPWTHWMAGFSPSRVLLDDYRLVHGDDGVAGIPVTRFGAANPILVQNLVEQTGSAQTNLFPSPVIEDEVQQSAPGQPADNGVVGDSPTWQALFQRARTGQAIPPPFHDIKITDPARVDDLAAQWRAGVDVPDADVPDLRTAMRVEAEFATFVRAAPGQSGRELLVQMCAQCHNGRSDPSLSKNNFDVFDLDGLSTQQKDTIVDRLRRPADDRYRMPPTFLRGLTDDEIDTIERFLRDAR